MEETVRKANHKQMLQTLQFTFILKKCFVKNTPTKALEQQVFVSLINTSDSLYLFIYFSQEHLKDV